MAVDTIYLKNEQGVDVPYQLGADSRNVTYSPNAETVDGSVHKELQQNNIHKNTIIANSTGVHGLRYTDNKLQVQAPGGSWTPIENGDMKKADYDDPSQNGVIAIAHGGTGNTSGYVRAGAASGSTIGTKATAEGADTQAKGYASHAEGLQTKAIGLYSHAEGWQSTANGDYSHAEGEAFALARFGHAENTSTVAEDAEAAHAEGVLTRAEGWGSHSEGEHTIAGGDYSHAEGSYTQARGDYSHAEGKNTSAAGVCSHIGGDSIKLSGDYSFAFGTGNPHPGTSEYTEVKTNSSFTMVHAPRQKFGADLDGYIFGVSMKPDSLEYDDGSEFPPLDGRMGACITLEPDQAMNYGKKCKLAPGGMYLLMIGAEDTQNIQHSTYSIFVSSAGTVIINNINYTDPQTALVEVNVSTNTCIAFTMTQSPSSAKAVCQLIRIA